MESPERRDLENAARTFFAQFQARLQHPMAFGAYSPEDGIEYASEMSARRMAELEQQIITGDFDRAVVKLAEELLSTAGLPSQPGHALWRLAARLDLERNRARLHHLSDPIAPYAAHDPLFQSAVAPTPVLTLSPSPSWSELAEKHLTATAPNLASSTLAEKRRALGWGKDFFGDAPLSSLSKANLRDFRDALKRLSRQHQGAAKIPFIKRLTDDPSERISTKTANKYWTFVRTFTAWAAQEGYTDGDAAANLTLPIAKADKSVSPKPFTPEELRALFESPLFSGHESASTVTKPGPVVAKGSLWWTFPLALFTGLRIGEIAQLLTTDFDFSGPIATVQVRETDDSGKLVKSAKTASSLRQVPLAPPLLDLGLREFVEGRRKKWGEERLLRDVAAKGGSPADALSKKVGYYLRQIGLHEKGRGAHAFRHTFADALRAKSVSEDLIGSLLGHSAKTMTGHYGSGFSLEAKSEAVSKLDFQVEWMQLPTASPGFGG